VLTDKSLQMTEEPITGLKAKLSAKSRTARLWIQYFDLVILVKQFILADQTGT